MVEAVIGSVAFVGLVLTVVVAVVNELKHDKHAHEKVLKLSGYAAQTLV